MLLRLVSFSLLAVTCFCNLYAEQLALNPNAESAILINADTGKILYEKNARTPLYPASITKIATAAYVLNTQEKQLNRLLTADSESIASISEEAKRRSNYTLPAYWLEPGGSHIGIKKGEELALRDLLFGLMVASGNDAANVIAQNAGGTIPEFMANLNDWVRQIGCQHTKFLNPHGLHHPKHQTTAYDMALIAREAVKNPIFCEIVSTVRFTRPKTNKQEPTTYVQTNRLLRSGKFHYPKAFGIKTGHTSQAQNTLVAAAKQGDRRLIAVLMKVKEREDIFKDAVKMFETAFNQPKVQRLLMKKGPQKYALEIPGAAAPIKTYIAMDATLDYYPAEEPQIKCLLYWDRVNPPIQKNQKVGELRIQTPEGQIIQTIPLLAQADIKSTWLHWIKLHLGTSTLTSMILVGAGLIVMLVLVIAFLTMCFRR